jgi:4-hydroxybutyrate CoA-transferase
MVLHTSADDAVRGLVHARRIFITSGCGEPQTLVEALVASNRREPLQIVTGLQGGSAPYLVPASQRAAEWPFSVSLFMSSRTAAQTIAEGRGDYIPISLSAIPAWLRQRPNAVDAALVQVAPPDAEGRCSLGTTVAYAKAAIAAAPFVVAEMNRRMPRTCGDSYVALHELDVVVETDRQLVQVPQEEPTALMAAIARHVASLIGDGDCLQVGVSALATGIWREVGSRNDLGVHAGSVADGIVHAMQVGVVNNSRKSIDAGRTVANQLIGTDVLYDFANENPHFRLVPADYSNDARVIGALRNFVSVNSALEVDLAGQVNSEVLDGRYLAGVGGALDFAIGARLSEGGRSIIALPSTARGRSRIVARIASGNVTIPATLVDYVVTEHGIADLRGASVAERAQRLVAIAAPDCQGELRQQFAAKRSET